MTMTRIVSSLPKGSNFVRAAIAQAVAKGDPMGAAAYAASRWGVDSVPARTLKAAVAPGTTEGTWGSELVDFEAAAAEFYALVRQRSAVGKLIGLRNVPMQTRLVQPTEGVAAYWIPEGAPIPLTRMSFTENPGLIPNKLAAIAVMTSELARISAPSAETVVRDDMVAAVAEALDEAFFDPANAGVEDERPASITYGVTPTPATASPRADLKRLFETFKGDLDAAFLIASPAVLTGLSGADRPNVGARGGDIAGIPAIPAKSMGDTLALIDPTSIAYGDGELTQDASAQATIQLDSTPAKPVTSSTTVTSLWQLNLLGVRIIKRVNWQRVRAGVSLISGASGYGE